MSKSVQDVSTAIITEIIERFGQYINKEFEGDLDTVATLAVLAYGEDAEKYVNGVGARYRKKFDSWNDWKLGTVVMAMAMHMSAYMHAENK